LDTLRGIYSGKITTWGEAGSTLAPDDAIHTYQRNRNSGSQELMDKLVMRGTPMIDSPDMILETMMGPIHAIGGDPLMGVSDEGDPLGIGYSVYFYAGFIFPHENLKIIGVDGVLPSADTIASGAYPLATEVYAVVRDSMPRTSNAVLLRDWLLTEEGQAVIEESGYVSLRN
jgi:ABC-type phosphate transport system substrate-binding protein